MEEEFIHHLETENISQMIESVFRNCMELMPCLLRCSINNKECSHTMESLQMEIFEILDFLPALTDDAAMNLNAVDFT